MKKKLHYCISALLLILSISCKKEEGFGGNSNIHGTVMLNHYNQNFTLFKGDEVAVDEYVYIVFKEGSGYGTRVKTAYDGSFEFTNLRKGDYTVYAYSMDTLEAATSNNIAIVKEVSITQNKQSIDVGEIEIFDNKPQGHSKVDGKVYEMDTQTSMEYYLGETQVYIIYDNDINYSASIKTNYNGEYEFDNLPYGHYTVYTYSKDVNDLYPDSDYAVVLEFDIWEYGQLVNLPDLIVYK